MRILGIDPGLTTAGIGLIEVESAGVLKALDWLTITTSPSLPLSERILELCTDLSAYLDEAKPDLCVVEQLFFATNKKTAMDVSQARGAIVLTLRRQGIEVLDATPLQLKTAVTGDGQADKKQMQSMVRRMLRLEETPSPADAADALALAIYGSFQKRFHESSTRPRSTSQLKRPVA